jgi:hypothetical protein
LRGSVLIITMMSFFGTGADDRAEARDNQ